MAAVSGYCRATVSTFIVGALMFREPVSSSMIAAIGFDEVAGTLEVEFVSGAVFRYHRVALDVYEGLRAAPSKGRFFNRHIRDAYPWESVER